MRHQNGRLRYLSYLLRLWETTDGEQRIWRAALMNPGADDWQGFGTLDELFRFLRSRVEDDQEGEERV